LQQKPGVVTRLSQERVDAFDGFVRGLRDDRAKYHGPPPQCVTCSRFVKVSDPATRTLHEFGDYGSILSTEFECGRCAAARIAPERTP
jgi:hypothetical protein